MIVESTRKVLTTFICFVIAIGFISTAIIYQSSGMSAGAKGLTGLFVGAIACTINYLLLNLMLKLLSSSNYFMAVQAYLARMLIYLAASLLVVRLGMEATITFSAAIIAIAASLFVVFGLKAMKNNR